jgi:hypothetical protein
MSDFVSPARRKHADCAETKHPFHKRNKEFLDKHMMLYESTKDKQEHHQRTVLDERVERELDGDPRVEDHDLPARP